MKSHDFDDNMKCKVCSQHLPGNQLCHGELFENSQISEDEVFMEARQSEEEDEDFEVDIKIGHTFNTRNLVLKVAAASSLVIKIEKKKITIHQASDIVMQNKRSK